MGDTEKIENNRNISFFEKGNQLYELGKTLGVQPSQKQKECFERAIQYYLKSGDKACFCNLAHCYFLLAWFYNIKREEYYRKSIEYHIRGSRNKKYQFESFYKFYTVDENNIDMVLRTIRLTKPSTFNDPTDCPIAQEDLPLDIFQEKTVFDGLRICCFGQEKGKYRAWEDGSKWAYYGNMHRGICVRYRFFNNILEDNFCDKYVFKMVDYEEEFDFQRGIVADGFLRKTKDYQDENEWRIVWYDREYQNSSFVGRNDQNIYLPIGQEHIYQIFVGCRTSITIVKKVLEFANSRSPRIPVTKIQPSKENVFKLVGVQLN